MFKDWKRIVELEQTLKVKELEILSLKAKVESYFKDAIRYRQVNEYSSWDLTTPEGLTKFKDELLKREKELAVSKETMDLNLKLKDKDIENLKNIIKERDERIELLKSLVKKG